MAVELISFAMLSTKGNTIGALDKFYSSKKKNNEIKIPGICARDAPK